MRNERKDCTKGTTSRTFAACQTQLTSSNYGTATCCCGSQEPGATAPAQLAPPALPVPAGFKAEKAQQLRVSRETACFYRKQEVWPGTPCRWYLARGCQPGSSGADVLWAAAAAQRGGKQSWQCWICLAGEGACDAASVGFEI